MAPEAENGIAKRTHDFIAPAIVWTIGMLAAVKLDDEPFFPASKIGEIRPNRKLPREFVPAQLSAL
jgi:hypothetical protein